MSTDDRKQKPGKNGRKVIIITTEVVAEGHHGGAWKVAYADFVTAMMAFFLLMWLLNATTEAQRQGLADYFSPSNPLSHQSSGMGKPLGGQSALDKGDMVSDRGSVEVAPGSSPPGEQTDGNDVGAAQESTSQDPVAMEAHLVTVGSAALAAPSAGGKAPAPVVDAQALARAERQAFDQAAQQIRDAVASDPALATLARQLRIDMTPEGLRIQIMDDDRQPMFPTGSATPNDQARLLLQKISAVLGRLPEGISIAGHTDAAPFQGPGRTNWDLSADRANATRRLLVDAGLPDARIRTVIGHAARDPLIPGDPMAAANRRIAIVVLRAHPAMSDGARPS